MKVYSNTKHGFEVPIILCVFKARRITGILFGVAMSKRLKLCLAIFLLQALFVPAQEAPPKLSGRVTEADNGAPVKGATVTLIPPFMSSYATFPSAKTDQNGDYKFETVADGVYSIMASAEGFVHQDYRADTSPEGALVRLDSLAHLRNIDFRLEPEAQIRGTVWDHEGKPVSNVTVSAVRQDDAAKNRLVPTASAKTDAQGQFVLKGLPAATYLVCASGPVGYGDPSNAANWYRESWFGGTSSSHGATPIPLKARGEQRDVQIVVEREARYRVVVWPSGPDGAPVPDRYDVTIQHRNHSSTRQPDGSYLIPDIPSGHYTLISTAWSNAGYLGMGERSFDVSDSDVSVQIHVGGLGEIAGNI